MGVVDLVRFGTGVAVGRAVDWDLESWLSMLIIGGLGETGKIVGNR